MPMGVDLLFWVAFAFDTLLLFVMECLLRKVMSGQKDLLNKRSINKILFHKHSNNNKHTPHNTHFSKHAV
jgi:hypothetical protein